MKVMHGPMPRSASRWRATSADAAPTPTSSPPYARPSTRDSPFRRGDTMNLFSYIAAANAGQAIQERANATHSAYLAGGTNLLDHIKLGIEQPNRLIDILKLGYDRIERLPDGGLRIGAT